MEQQRDTQKMEPRMIYLDPAVVVKLDKLLPAPRTRSHKIRQLIREYVEKESRNRNLHPEQ